MADQNCGHAGCECETEEGQGVSKGGEFFCSDECAKAGASSSDTCDCGHADCQ